MNPKIKVGFYCQNQGYPNVDIRFPEKGNPGMGGTQFSEIATAYYLNKYYSEQLEILLLANLADLLPPSLEICQVVNVLDAAVKSEQAGCDILVTKSKLINDNEICNHLSKLKIKIIARSNNYLTDKELNRITNCQQIKAHVCVGQEQLDLLLDHRIYNKSIRIFDPFNPENFIPKNKLVKQGNTVVFLGNIIPKKGFHHLAQVWPYIIRQRQDARLIVIGSGKLYDRKTKLGKWGIAEESYESNYLRPFLSDDNGNIIESVHFAGLLGHEKIEILQNADVGVVNPSGMTEVCPGSALEIQACGTPVVSTAKWGLLDTVVHGKTGLLGKSDQELAKNILYLLNNSKLCKQFGKNGINFVREKFDHRLIARQWLELFTNINNNKSPQPQPMKQNYLYNFKFLRGGMRIVKQYIPLLRNVPALIEIKPFLKRFIKKRFIFNKKI